jgi:hypothetical protein
MGGLEVAATLITVAIAGFNVVWTVRSQRRDREERQRERDEQSAERSRERTEEQERWIAAGHLVSLKAVHYFDADEQTWAVLEVRNTGRGPCTIAEVGYWYAPEGPTYIYYSSEPDTGYELEKHSPPLPYVLEGGRRADWTMSQPTIQSTVRDQEHGANLQLLVELENGERHTVPYPLPPLAD